jgi:phospholysine phosphohistidine inorganic pyrophosphate phosphatase
MDDAMRGILFDLDGVLYNSEEPINGAAEAVGWAQANNIPHLFVTNTTSRGRDALVEKMFRFGIRAERLRILTPCVAAAEWLKTHNIRNVALFVNPEALDEFEGIATIPAGKETGADCVVIGDLGDAWDFRTLNRAFRLLHSNRNATLVALGMTRFWHAEDGIRLDVGPFAAALERASGRNALILGKPAKPFFQTAISRLDMPPHEIVMVGDDIETDIAGAQQAGMKGMLLRTGKFRPSDLEGPIKPDAILNSIRELPDWWERQEGQL